VQRHLEPAVDRRAVPGVAHLSALVDDGHCDPAGLGLREYLVRRGPLVDLGGVVHHDGAEVDRLSQERVERQPPGRRDHRQVALVAPDRGSRSPLATC